jgi:hypothetical protein
MKDNIYPWQFASLMRAVCALSGLHLRNRTAALRASHNSIAAVASMRMLDTFQKQFLSRE